VAKAGLCWMAEDAEDAQGLAQASRRVRALKDRAANTVMSEALQRGFPLRDLYVALMESAASCLASGLVLDGVTKALCGKTDEEHIEDACAQFRAACERQLVDARQTLLTPPVAFPPDSQRPS
jgi:hypothetical protein